MKVIKSIFKVLSIVAVFASCDGAEQDIEAMIQDKNNPVKYVIEGQISNVVKKHHIFISKPGKINGSKNYESVHNAKVTVSDGVNTWVFKELPKNSPKYDELEIINAPKLITGGVYESESYFAGQAGKTYTLKVVVKGEEFTAKEIMPKIGKMDDEEFTILKNIGEFSLSVFGTKKPAIWVVQRNLVGGDKESLKPVILGRINFFTRNHIDDSRSIVSKDLIITEKTSILKRYTPTPEYTDYLWAYVFGNGAGLTSVDQNPHPSNFNSKKIAGYFSVLNSVDYEVNMKGYKEYLMNYFSESKTYTANYKGKGSFTLKMNADGQCELIGKGEKLVGAYDKINEKQVRVYFKPKGSSKVKDLYHFYEETLKQAYIYVSGDMMIYRSNQNAFFDIQSNGNIKAQDGTVWNVE